MKHRPVVYRFGLVIFFTVISSSIAVASTHYVDINSLNPLSPYTSWSTAARDLYSAMATARSGDTILITNGTYTICPEIAVTNAIEIKSMNGANVTIFDSKSSNRCFTLQHGSALLEGFTIKNGNSGGIVIHEGTVRQSTICSNWSEYFGGGVVLYTGVVESCLIQANEVSRHNGNVFDRQGGGIFLEAGGVIRDSTIEYNSVRDSYGPIWGGGVYAKGGLIEQCIIRGNSCAPYQTGPGYGGGLFMENGKAQNCLIMENRTDYDSSLGGGVYLSNGVLANLTIVKNSSFATAGGLYCVGGTLANVIVASNTAPAQANFFAEGNRMTISHSCIPGLTSNYLGLVGADPVFRNYPTGDYRLSSNSPCIDAGTFCDAPSDDLDSSFRPVDGDHDGITRYDIGAYEYHETGFTGLSNGGVSPWVGSTNVFFRHYIEYCSALPPTSSVAVIDGSPHAMSLAMGIVTNGYFSLSTNWHESVHLYHFEFYDSSGLFYRWPSTGNATGPVVVSAWGLSDGGVSPLIGETSTVFGFEVSWDGSAEDGHGTNYVCLDSSLYGMSLSSGEASNGVFRFEKGLLSQGAHSYYFYHLDDHGLESRWPPQGVIAGPQILLPAPTGLAATDGSYTDRVMATWAPVILAEGYELWRGPSNDVELAGLLGNASTSPYIDFTVTATQGNYYWVRATNSITSGTFSTPNFGYCGLPAPLGLVASDGVFTDRVTLSWSSVPGAEAYEVWRHTLDTTNGAGWLALWNASTNYADIVAVPGYRFYYWVKSKNQVGAGLISQSESGFLMLSPPSSVMASYGTVPNGVGVNWASVDGSDWYEVWWNDSSSTVGVEKIADCVAWTNYLDSEITPGMIGYYWIKASGTLSTSALSVAYDNGMIAGDPEIPESIGIATRLQGISLCCQTITGRSYRVQGTTNLMANWTNLYTTFTPGRGRLTSIFTTDIDSQLFLRVESTNSP